MKTRASDTTPLTAAQADLVESHADWARRGAHKNAARFAGFVTVDDLMSAAYLGLILAARRFDPSRGLAFKTLAMPYCESLMRREIDTIRRLNGCVFDARVEGGMRTVLQRIEWPTYEDGQPRDLAAAPASQFSAVDHHQRRTLVAAATSRHDRRLVRLILDGQTHGEIARQLGVRTSTLCGRIDGLTRRLRARLGAAVAA